MGDENWMNICCSLVFPVSVGARSVCGTTARVQPIGVAMVRGCGSDMCINFLLCFIGLGACHSVHVLLEDARGNYSQ
jgi:uncharacterized membrane protein YqaE (UPF0057 family)